eukprot:CAMPEP_0116841188 /NCGR_PEP_ID=MMETSP0418-20121206/10785_1 /TAXON_ID=1158023 /ORGANISM="Astrosyne radiata, Strain 13vi08-1A" /LENGTH=221 /DNA_ID=CAMNT_0004471585 /DNA_START=69 /DNA_END=732 /DNA_ORIENTATION=+
MASKDLSDEDIADLKEAFSMFDINGDGTIELHELQQVMKKLGQRPSEAELIEMINSVDGNGDNEIDFEEFLILMKSRIGERDPEKELRDAFNVFDSDGSGAIDRKELKRLMKKLGQALSDAELDAMMSEVDTNGDGEISFEEFKAMMQSSFVDCAWGGEKGSLMRGRTWGYREEELQATYTQHFFGFTDGRSCGSSSSRSLGSAHPTHSSWAMSHCQSASW